jgi:hypothetical protein
MYSPDAPHRHMSGQRNGCLFFVHQRVVCVLKRRYLHGLSFRPSPVQTLRETAAGVRTADLIEQHHVCLELPENKKIIKDISFVQRLILDYVDKADLLTYRDIHSVKSHESVERLPSLPSSPDGFARSIYLAYIATLD